MNYSRGKTVSWEMGGPPKRRSQMPQDAPQSNAGTIKNSQDVSEPHVENVEIPSAAPLSSPSPVSKPQAGSQAEGKAKRVYRQSAGVTDLALIPLPVFDNMDACAATTFIPKSVLKAAKKRGCAAFKHSRVDLAVLLKFLFVESKDEKAGVWKDVLEEARARREMIRLSKDEGKVIERGEVTFGVNKATALLFGALDSQSALLPPSLKGCDEIQIQTRLLSMIETIKQTFRAELEKFTVEEKVNNLNRPPTQESKQNKL